jgi:hypothetical protein
MDLTTEFNILGKWFLPYKEHQSCFGELGYSFSGGLQLKIFGSLTGTEHILKSKHNFVIDCIWGKTEDGKCVTALSAFGQEFGSDGLIQSRYILEYVCLSSTHFLTIETDQFDLVSLNFNCSESFFSSLYNRIKRKERDGNGNIQTLQHEGTHPKEIYRDGIFDASLFFDYTSSFSHTKSAEFSFSQTVYLNSTFNSPLPFEEAVTYSKNIRALFSFFSVSKVFIKKFSIRERESKEIFAVLFFQENKANIEKLGLGDLLLQYREMEGEFEQSFKWWVSNKEYVTYGLSLYQQFVYSIGLTSVQKFLNIVFALETLHATFFDGKNFTDDEYRTFKNQKKLFQMDELFRARFNECISNFNTMSFKKRIQELFELNRQLMGEYIDNIDDFASKVRDQRNYYAHKHSIEGMNLIPLEHLDYYVFMCKLIFDVTLLKLIGISENNVKTVLNRDFIFGYYKEKKPTSNVS